MKREEVLELMKTLDEELPDLGLTPKVGNNYWPADDSYTLQVFAHKLYTQNLEQILNFARKHELEVLIEVEYGRILVEFYDIKHRDGDW